MKVSVAMCTYNGQKYLEDQLQSLATQSRLPDELIVSDDCSSDNTVSMLHNFSQSAPFPTLIKQNQQNIGVVANFESAIAMTDGDIVFLSDQDDVWASDRVATVSKIFEQNDNIGLVISNAEIVGHDLSSQNKTLWQSLPITVEEIAVFEKNPFEYLLTKKNIVTGAAAAFSRDSVSLALPFPKSMAVLHDAWLGLIAASMSNVKLDPNLSLKYRQHDAQLVGTRSFQSSNTLSHYQAHYNQLLCLRERLDCNSAQPAISLIDDYLLHLCRRTTLPKPISARLAAVIREASTGRYTRFSNGLRSIVKDIAVGM